jgi:hypothetical protein
VAPPPGSPCTEVKAVAFGRMVVFEQVGPKFLFLFLFPFLSL